MSKTVTFTFGCGDDSGAGRMGFYFSREFRRAGWDVSAICPKPEPDASSVVERLNEIGVKVDVLSAFSGFLNPRVVNQFAAHLNKHRPNAVVSLHQQDMKFAGLAARRVGLKYVVSGQNILTFSGGRYKQRISGLIMGWILNRSCSLVVATSDRVAADFRRLVGFQGPVCLQPNGVDTAIVRAKSSERDSVREKFGYSRCDCIIASVGRVTQQKNQIGLIDAFNSVANRFKNSHLLIIGGTTQDAALARNDLEYLNMINDRIKKYGLGKKITITGWRKDVPSLLAAADLYVQCSLWEGSPLAVVEAMAAGLPVIVTNNGGILPKFRHGEHGFVVPVNDTRMLGQALQDVLKMPIETRVGMGRCGQQMACSFYDAKIVAQNFVDIVTHQLKER